MKLGFLSKLSLVTISILAAQSAQASGAPTLVNSGSCSINATTCTVTFSTQPGDLLVAMVQASALPETFSMADTLGNTWSIASPNTTDATNNWAVQMFYA